MKKPQIIVDTRSNSESPTNEVPRHVVDMLNEKGFDVDEDGVVKFQPNSRALPREWSLYRKLYDTTLICFLEFFMTLMV